MRIPLDPQSSLPLYRQIENYFRTGILNGNLAPDMRLPASRQLASDLGISRITIENAYAELKADGLVASKGGSGTYVLPPYPLHQFGEEGSSVAWPLWQQDLLTSETRSNKLTPMEMLTTAEHPDPISFAEGVGDPLLFPVDDFRRAVQAVFHRDGLTALEYGEHNGFSPLRVIIARLLASQGLQTHAANILITSGSQQALWLVAQLLLKPGDVVLVESPTYARALELFRTLGLRIVGVPVDEQGMQVDGAEELLQQFHPKLIYTIPNFQNPTGACMNSRRRHQLVALADRYNVPILEDDFVGDLRYEGRAQPALKAIDPGGRVIYMSTFSKMLLPGLRIGFLIVEGPVYEKLVHQKHVHDLATSNLIQRALEVYVTVGRYEAHLRRSCQLYRKRRDTMVRAINRHLSPMFNGLHVTSPQGGLFLWLRLPGNLSVEQLLPLACEEGVTFSPGSDFFPERSDGANYLRLNFATFPPDVIETGIVRLSKAVQRLIT